jgi:hypothetical protein
VEVLDDDFLIKLTEELTLHTSCNESLIYLCSYMIKKHDFDEENRAMLLKKLLTLGKLNTIKELAESEHLEDVLTSDFINDYFENDLYALPLESMKYLFSFLDKECECTQITLDKTLLLNAKNHSPKVTKWLLEEGANPNYLKLFFFGPVTPLSQSLEEGDVESSNILIRYGAKLFFGDNYNALGAAVKSNNLDAVKLVIDETPAEQLTPDVLSTALVIHCSYFKTVELNDAGESDTAIADLLLSKGANLYYSRSELYNNRTALLNCLSTGNFKLFKHISKKAKTTLPEDEFKDVVNSCVSQFTLISPNKDSDITGFVSFLKENGHLISKENLNKELNQISLFGNSALNVMKIFIDLGADVNGSGNDLPLINAVKEKQFNAAHVLIAYGAKLSNKHKGLVSELATNNDVPALRLLTSVGSGIPKELSNDDCLLLLEAKTWDDAVDQINPDDGELLLDILPRYYSELMTTPLEFMEDCPDWQKPYVLRTMSEVM